MVKFKDTPRWQTWQGYEQSQAEAKRMRGSRHERELPRLWGKAAQRCTKLYGSSMLNPSASRTTQTEGS
jgi:hypothetical protein